MSNYSPKTNKDASLVTEATGAAYLTSIAGYSAAGHHGKFMLENIPNVGKNSTVHSMRKEHGLEGIVHDLKDFETPNKGAGPHYINGHIAKLSRLKEGVYMGRNSNPGVYAHEMGHAVSHNSIKNPFLRKLHTASQVLRKPGLAGGVSMGMLLSDDKKTNDAAIPAYLAMKSPTLIEEANANRHAFNAFKKHEGKNVANRFLKTVAMHNTLNYAIPVAAGTAGLYLAKKILGRDKHK